MIINEFNILREMVRQSDSGPSQYNEDVRVLLGGRFYLYCSGTVSGKGTVRHHRGEQMHSRVGRAKDILRYRGSSAIHAREQDHA